MAIKEAPYFSDRPFLTNGQVNNTDNVADDFVPELAATQENSAAGQAALTHGDPRVKTSDAFVVMSDANK